ncbi:MAG: serine protease, partial [Planctomycetota bacterium]
VVGLPPLSDSDLPLPKLIETVEKSVVRIHITGEYGSSTGSGFVVDKEGTIVTNYHVMEGALSAEAEFNTGEKTPITGFWKLDEFLDLAIVDVDLPADQLHPIRIATELPQKGISVAAFGAPLGLSFTASEGIISATREADEVGQEQGTYVQTTTPISPGNSGGPLVNMRGEVVGANSFKRADGENVNFAISSLDILSVLQDKGQSLGQISPETIPVKLTGGFGGVEDLSGTERGQLLLSQIRDAVVVIQPFSYDPTGRIADFLEVSAERTILDRAGWTRVQRRSQIRGSTAIVVVVTYFRVGEETTDDNLVSEVVIDMAVMARDVDRGGKETLAIVWSEKEGVGTTSLKSLMDGRVTRTLESGVGRFFKKFLSDYRKAEREARGQ